MFRLLRIIHQSARFVWQLRLLWSEATSRYFGHFTDFAIFTLLSHIELYLVLWLYWFLTIIWTVRNCTHFRASDTVLLLYGISDQVFHVSGLFITIGHPSSIEFVLHLSLFLFMLWGKLFELEHMHLCLFLVSSLSHHFYLMFDLK